MRILVITANASINKAVDAMRAGACDFLVKPFDETRFLNAVRLAQTGEIAPIGALSQLTPANRPQRPAPLRSPDPVPEPAPLPRFIGPSAQTRALQDKITRLAASSATVFITGESGTGKELCAQSIHQHGSRANGPFIALNCAAIPHDLLEAEIFGYLKGSFTGALSDREGAFMAADGGTLFLDEICEMPLALQAKLLRLIETSSVQPLGASRPRKVDVRILCATNRDPRAAVAEGSFREDLYYRLVVVPLHLPALREHREDIPAIAASMLEMLCQGEGRQFKGFTEDTLQAFARHPWPGNVRQMINVIRYVLALHDEGATALISPEMLPEDFLRDLSKAKASAPSPAQGLEELLHRPWAEIERHLIEAALTRHEGSVPETARVLRLSPSTLYRKIESWNNERA